MVASAKADLIEGSSIKEEKSRVISIVRTFHVNGLVSTGDDKLEEAMTASGIPVYDELHPTIVGLRVTDRSAEPIRGMKEALVHVVYGVAGTTSQEDHFTNTSLEQVQTNQDKNDTPISVIWVGDGKPQGGIVNTTQSRQQIIIVRTEKDISPLTIGDTYVNKTNSLPWPPNAPRAKNTWLCVSITSSSDAWTAFEMRYEFTYRKNGWDPVVWYIDVTSGKPPSDLVDGEGYKTVLIYDEANFNDLNFADIK